MLKVDLIAHTPEPERGIVNFAGSTETICKKSRKKETNLDKAIP